MNVSVVCIECDRYRSFCASKEGLGVWWSKWMFILRLPPLVLPLEWHVKDPISGGGQRGYICPLGCVGGGGLGESAHSI